jgi:hypothetical protein
MSEIRTRALDSSQNVALTTASIFAAIMLEMIVGKLSELSSGQVLTGSSGTVLIQCALLVSSVGIWWVGYATVTSIARWALSPFDLLAQVAVGALALLLIENVAVNVTTEFLALSSIVYVGGAGLNRFIVEGVRKQQAAGPDPFEHYPHRLIRYLFFTAAGASTIALLTRPLGGPHPIMDNSLVLAGAIAIAGATALQLRWWTRATAVVELEPSRP